jgi:hypothetical protein
VTRWVIQAQIKWCNNLVHTCAGEYDWLFHWQHKWCVTLSTNVNINYRLPIKVYVVGSIYGRSSIKIVHFGSIRSKHGRHRQFTDDGSNDRNISRSLWQRLLKSFDEYQSTTQILTHLFVKFEIYKIFF